VVRVTYEAQAAIEMEMVYVRILGGSIPVSFRPASASVHWGETGRCPQSFRPWEVGPSNPCLGIRG